MFSLRITRYRKGHIVTHTNPRGKRAVYVFITRCPVGPRNVTRNTFLQ